MITKPAAIRASFSKIDVLALCVYIYLNVFLFQYFFHNQTHIYEQQQKKNIVEIQSLFLFCMKHTITFTDGVRMAGS